MRGHEVELLLSASYWGCKALGKARNDQEEDKEMTKRIVPTLIARFAHSHSILPPTQRSRHDSDGMTTSSSSSRHPGLLALALLPLLAAGQSLYGTLPFVDEKIQGLQVGVGLVERERGSRMRPGGP